jgi:hypothetical protein
VNPARKEQGGFHREEWKEKIIPAKSSRGQEADHFQDRQMWAGDGQGVCTCRCLHHRNHRHYYPNIFLSSPGSHFQDVKAAGPEHFTF